MLMDRLPGPPSRLRLSVEAAKPVSFWMDDPEAPDSLPALAANHRCDLVVVGGGFSGLWTALLAKQADPGRRVTLIEAHRVGWAATGRNGGFCEASLTHGEPNGRERFPDSYRHLATLGLANLDAIEAFVDQHNVDCGWERTGALTVALDDWQVEELRGQGPTPPEGWLEGSALAAEVASPTYLAGLWERDTCALVNPSRLAWGLLQACLRLGVEVWENTPLVSLDKRAGGIDVITPRATIEAESVALGTNAFPSPLARVRARIVPVYDHVLMTEPLSAGQLASIGWSHRQGVADAGNRFHYYRLTSDNRILWGGWDATYHFGKQVRAAYDQQPHTFAMLAAHFEQTFPQLADLAFTHRWGGAIDTCGRFCAFFGRAMGGRVAYAAGYTGVGVGATRFGARVMLDLLSGSETELTELDLVRSQPLPFPPEPLAWPAIQATRWALARADATQGRRNLWLRTLDRMGLGFDS